MTQKQLIYSQILGKIKMSKNFKYYISYCWHYANEICKEITDTDTDYEVSKFHTQSGNPLIIDV
jgi:hypothetical protein